VNKPELDHLVYATPDLERTVEDLEASLGVGAAGGGRHLGEGTRNALIGLGASRYLEILGPDPSQPPPRRPIWLGLEGLGRPRLTAWAMRARNLDGVSHRALAAGARLGAVESGSRRRDDGSLLTWRFTDPHVVVADGLVPFFIDWGASPHPAASAPGGVSLLALRGEHPYPAGVASLLRALGVNLPITKGDRAALIAVLESSGGTVELR
jgi:Glyoxalase-like domain